MSKNIVRVNKNKNYTVMGNHHLKNKELSWKAKGIHSYILSLPDDWKVIIEHLKTVSTDGRDSTRSGIQELYDLRYWQRYPVHVDGKIDRWVTEIYEEPFPEEDKIENIVIRNGIKTINYDNNKKEEKRDPLTGNPRVVENTKVDLLTGNPQVGNPEVGNPELLSTKDTKDLCINNHSFNHSKDSSDDNNIKQENIKDKEKKDRKKDNTDKANIEELNKILDKAEINEYILEDKYRPAKRAIESLYYRNKPLEVNGMAIPQEQIREDLKSLNHYHVEIAFQIFSEVSGNQKIRNKIAYLAVCIYNAIFDMDLKIHNDLRFDGII